MRVADAFSRAAASYDSHASIQRQVAEDLLRCCEVPPRARVIDLGCGSGLLTVPLLTQHPDIRLACLDLAPGMLNQLKHNLERSSLKAERYIVGDARHYKGESYDLVLSSSALHWMEPVAGTIRSWSELCGRGGTLAFACMVRGTLDELHALRLREVPTVPPTRLLPQSAELFAAVTQAGLRTIYCVERDYRLELPHAMALYRSLRLSGTSSGPFSRGTRPLTVGELRRIARCYVAQFAGESGSIYATYRVTFVVAKRD